MLRYIQYYNISQSAPQLLPAPHCYLQAAFSGAFFHACTSFIHFLIKNEIEKGFVLILMMLIINVNKNGKLKAACS